MEKIVHDAMQLARSGRLDEAGGLLQRVLSAAPGRPDALQLLGLIRRRQGRPEEAEALFRRSLAADPLQPHVHNNLGNLLAGLGRREAAIECYRTACRLQSDYAEARHNLGLALLAAGDADAAAAVLEEAAAIDPGDAGIRVSLGNTLKALRRFDEAEGAYREALALNPDHVNALHNLGVRHKDSGRVREGLALIERAAGLAPGRAELHYSLGHALLAAGRIEDALDAWRAAVQLAPDYTEAHDTLNKVMWQHGRRDDYLSSYRQATRKRPRAADLWIDWADKLILAGRSAEAVSVLEEAQAAGHEEPDFDHRLARALSLLGQVGQAEASFLRALVKRPEDKRYRLDLARLQIVLARYEEALDHLETALAAAPRDQEAIAYRGVCWRLLGDPREAALNDYDGFVRACRLPPPPGFPSIDAFNERLLSVLERLHAATEAPAEQTLRGGTQTLGDLFEVGGQELDALRRQFEAAVGDYIEGLAADVRHPLVGRRADGFRFSGSWSVRLRSGGHHVNHVHSEGWISSCYYVSVPSCVGDGQQGWLRFGETSLHLGERERTARVMQPESGLLVLFPSYFFHGTIPFYGDTPRVTVAFDVVPD